ncbi:methyltransferase [Bryobacter aggregatus]|uniref:methyltransferase n=1 Tax=Bryobacter aggregatus TaxID=360054 RepID=UPI00068CABDE|nr:methyltransferase [Bryobacter aggregatus]
MTDELTQMTGGGVQPPVPQQILMQLATGAWVSKCIGIVAELGVADQIGEEPRPVSELAAACGARQSELYRVLRMLASVGLFVEWPEQRFSLTATSNLLRENAPGSMRSMLRMTLFGEHWRAWDKMLDVVQHGGIATNLAEGMDIWEFYQKNPTRAAIFNRAMTNFSEQSGPLVAEAFEFEQYGCVCDVGGGHGAQIEAILKHHPRLKGFVFDLDSVVTGANERFAASGLSDRAHAVGGNFFESVAPGADIYIAKNIIHDWDDERSIRILKNIRRAMPASGRVLLLEFTAGAANVPDLGKLMDINMMAMTGGKERTAEEFASLFAASGFKLGRILPTPSPVHVVEGLPV